MQNSTITRLKGIYYPATKTGYWFGAASETSYFSKYEMIRKVSERRAMNCTNLPTDLT